MNLTYSLKMQAHSAEIDSRASASNWAGLNLIYTGIKGCSFFQVESAENVKNLRCLPIKKMSIGANVLLMAQTALVKVNPITADDMISTDMPIATKMARPTGVKGFESVRSKHEVCEQAQGMRLVFFLR